MKISYLGIPGSFSYAAATGYVNNAVYISRPSFGEVFSSVEDGEADCGVVPIENTLAGSIYDNYDLLEKSNLFVVGECYVKVQHYLLAKQDVAITDVKEVYSHQKALEQCKEFFKLQPHMKGHAFSDTASAAKFVATAKEKNIAAIASKECAGLYDLKIVKSQIEDESNNITRFLIISSEENKKKADKCSIIVWLPHRPGSLSKLLAVLADIGVDLTKIESRPIVGKPFEYRFYLDFCYKTSIDDILQSVQKVVTNMRCLGVYKNTVEIEKL